VQYEYTLQNFNFTNCKIYVFTNHWVEYKAIWNEIYIYNVISYS